MGTSVAITGVGGLLGQRLLGRLSTDADVERVVGLDVTLPADLPVGDTVDLQQADVRDANLATRFAGCDVVVHLAFLMDEVGDRAVMRSINVDGTRSVFEAARRAGVAKVVYLSSAVAYGAHPDNDVPLTEDSALRANPDFAYAEDKLAVERWLEGWRDEHRDVEVVVLRPWIVAGRDVDNWFVRQLVEGTTLGLRRVFNVRGYRPPWQFGHVDDVVAAITHAMRHDLSGPYNVACEGWLSYDEFLAITGLKPLSIPEGQAFALAEQLWKLDLVGGPPGAVHYVMHPIVLSVERLVATGWRPRHTNREALRELREAHAEWLPVKHGVRVRRRDVRIGAALAGTLALLGTAAAVVGRDE
ncbi:MAG: NAD-dependent epimerase/dehydratase family protein [Actinobacteria bacterium]|nr:NAD-dependent epimerase/dehydratase family protein [Actinomycetota bacterium]